MVLYWETASAKDFNIEVSDDSVNWTAARAVTNGPGGVETLNITGATGRYIRMYGISRNTPWGYSLWEFQVFGTSVGGNQAPAADAGSGQTVSLPVDSVVLNGSASYDPDGTILQYRWSQISGPPASLYSLDLASVVAGHLTGGNYTFRLSVVDNGGIESTSDVNITVLAPPRVAAITVSPATATLMEGQTQQYTALATDQYGNPIAFSPVWSVSDTGVSITSAGLLSAVKAGTYTVTASYDSITATSSLTVNPAGHVNIALDKPINATSVEGAFAAANANDGDMGTRWGSSFSDPQILTIDLLAKYNITQVVLTWETASAKAYTLEVSDDSVNWTAVQTVTSGSGGTETWNLSNVSGRYIRMHGTVRNTPYGYSIYEFEVYGTVVKSATLNAPVNSNRTNGLIYPSPFRDQITIDLGSGSSFRKASLFDFQGRLVVDWVMLPGERLIHRNLGALASGIYFIRLVGPSGIKVFKIVKQ